ncbi:MAG TPA: hypothetical protein VID03_06610 [Acidimicrobiia bacterium]|jgi:hypothetical protein
MGALLGFIAIYTIGLFAYGQAVGSPLTNLYTIINVVLFGVFWLLHRSVRFPLPVLWGLALVGLGNMLGGVLLVDGNPLYLTPVLGSMRYDKIFHAAASAIGVWACWVALRSWAGSEPNRSGLMIASLLMVMGAGAFVELAEFAGTAVNPDVNVGDYGNNMLDIVANLVGGLVGLTVIAFWSSAAAATISPGADSTAPEVP